ncbi:MAG: hypothetical protein KBB88_01250 [Candidatus Pacebacteria bacterium]|nr:hypothetical protein [Candidatus Paceibacterota bacterium]
MPIIRIDYDDNSVQEKKMQLFAEAIKDIVSVATGIPEVSVYANASHIKVNIAPIEIFVHMSAHIISDLEILFTDVQTRLIAWKKENNYYHCTNEMEI